MAGYWQFTRDGAWTDDLTSPAEPSRRGQGSLVTEALSVFRIDFTPRHEQPGVLKILAATIISLGGSLGADALLVAIGTRIFPSTKGYGHFQFSDYGKLTVIGVLIACAAWPIVTRISSSPRWVFLRMAVLVTLVLWLPDLYILAKGQPPKAVAVLMVMHLAIGVVTYNALVRIAPSGPALPEVGGGPTVPEGREQAPGTAG